MSAIAVADPASIRVADSEREQVAEELREHMLAGRLSSAEFEGRLERAYASRTRGELEALKHDLPMSPAVLEAELARRRGTLRRRLLRDASGGITISGICVAIWAATGAHGAFWPVWVMIPTLLPAVGNLVRLSAGEGDPQELEERLNRRRSKRVARERRNQRRLER